MIKSTSESPSSKLKKGCSPPPPPPLPPLPKILVSTKPVIKQESTASVTKQEIAAYWRHKHKVEEDHLLAAIKAAAHSRVRNLWEDYYHPLEVSPAECDDNTENDKCTKVSNGKDENIKEVPVGIKDWWTKSKYAYLNQPGIKSMDTPSRRASSYKPQFYRYKTTPPTATTFGIF